MTICDKRDLYINQVLLDHSLHCHGAKKTEKLRKQTIAKGEESQQLKIKMDIGNISKKKVLILSSQAKT